MILPFAPVDAQCFPEVISVSEGSGRPRQFAAAIWPPAFGGLAG